MRELNIEKIKNILSKIRTTGDVTNLEEVCGNLKISTNKELIKFTSGFLNNWGADILQEVRNIYSKELEEKVIFIFSLASDIDRKNYNIISNYALSLKYCSTNTKDLFKSFNLLEKAYDLIIISLNKNPKDLGIIQNFGIISKSFAVKKIELNKELEAFNIKLQKLSNNPKNNNELSDFLYNNTELLKLQKLKKNEGIEIIFKNAINELKKALKRDNLAKILYYQLGKIYSEFAIINNDSKAKVLLNNAISYFELAITYEENKSDVFSEWGFALR